MRIHRYVLNVKLTSGKIHLTSFQITLYSELSTKITSKSFKSFEFVYVEVICVLENKAWIIRKQNASKL